ncbi:cAMP-dependent protein kinase catalytic subunit [Podospora pseudoanserina]|uniref:non-specific serine/threonine protein kinase n=1 Tax=Podospora pseudoanserina TaxID=2609844 RepID=A0ABR0HL72_9PEZI|nr:cAMP-dependent protein kinase catalytic subunit [Podospora pseudoanserina]
MECLRDDFQRGVILGGRYQTISPLNHGSFGQVLLAKDLRTSETVAIKCITKQSAANDAGIEFAIDEKSEEIAVHKHLGSHPNIVNHLDDFETEHHKYLVLEFCERGDLYEAIRIDHGPLETEHVRRFMLQLVDAVEYCHAKGVFHRDIKPENIFLTQDGSMKLGDFGLATRDEWTTEVMVGSDRYMSPEQYENDGDGYSPAQADIWAIGICLLNILFSRNPFATPTPADPLFLDFTRDKQSLFDVFPMMSADTFEVIDHCMNLDPAKRSLAATRQALLRVKSFTTQDEDLVDAFCSADRRVVASANREPLRTPSVQSPMVDTGAFPWAKALQATPPKPIRQLSIIHDYDEGYDEDLFSRSGGTDWFSKPTQTPMSSFVDSSLGASIQSSNLYNFQPRLPAKALAKVSPMAGSLPINMSKNRNQSAMSWAFSRENNQVSKSWSDLWDDEEEEQQQEQARQLQALKEMNSRTWSHESQTETPVADNDDTPRLGLSPITKTASVVNLNDKENEIPSIDAALGSAIDDDDFDSDGLFLYEAPPVKEEPQRPSRASPKHSGVDKWSVLGERRRACNGTTPSKAPEVTLRTGHHMGAGFPSNTPSKAHGVHDFFSSVDHHTPVSTFNLSTHNKNNNNHHHYTPHRRGSNHGKERIKECPWSKGRDRDWNFDWRKDKRNAFGDLEWVGGWPTAARS